MFDSTSGLYKEINLNVVVVVPNSNSRKLMNYFKMEWVQWDAFVFGEYDGNRKWSRKKINDQ